MNEHITRRQFLKTLAVLTAPGAIVLLRQESATAMPAIPVGHVRDFKPGEWKAVTRANGARVFVRRLPGRIPCFQALSALCTHKGCPVAWRPGEKHFVCPCHGGKFDANGRNVAGPPPTPLPVLPVKVVKGLVMVTV